MRAWITLTVALALAAIVPTAAQIPCPGGPQPQAPCATPSAAPAASATMLPAEATFVRHNAATGQRPELTVVEYNINGMPVRAAYLVRPEDRWLVANCQKVNWGQIQPGTVVTVPAKAPIAFITTGGAAGTGTVTAIDTMQNTMTVQLPNGEMRTVRYAPNAVYLNNGQLLPVSRLGIGETVLFEVPPSTDRVAIFTDVAKPRVATISAVGDGTVTLRFTEGGKEVLRNYSVQGITQFINAGKLVPGESFQTAYQPGETVYIYGSTSRPNYVVGDITQGFESAMVQPGQPEVAVAPTEQPAAVEQPAVSTTPSTTMVTGMAAPFTQGEFVSYTPAAGSIPPLVTLRFNVNGQPVLGTFPVVVPSNWTANGQPIDFATIQPGAMITVPETARMASLTTGGPAGVGTITAIDQANNTVSIRLPNGQLTTLRYTPQALVLQDGQVVSLSQLAPGQTIMFEVPPQGNQVALFQPIAPGTQATVTAVSGNSVTVGWIQNGQMMTRTIPTGTTMFINQGQQIAAADLAANFQPGQTVWLFGPPENPQIIASGVTTGFETAMVTPASAVVAEAPVAAPQVRGVREVPVRPARRRVVRGRW